MRLIDAEELIRSTILNPNHTPYITRKDIDAQPPIDLAKVVIDELEEAYDDLYEAKTEYESGLRDGIYAAMIRVEELLFGKEIDRARNEL